MNVTGPWFYISYAKPDAAGDLISRFYLNLAEEITKLTGKTSDHINQIGFFAEQSIEVGEEWPIKQAEALATTRTLICVYSPSYFQSEQCGKECQAFITRLDEFSKSTSSKTERPPLLLPVLWVPEESLPKPLPRSISSIQYLQDTFGSAYSEQGLRTLMKRPGTKEYRKFIAGFARQIFERARQYPLPPMEEPPVLSEVKSAFLSPDLPSPPPPPNNKKGWLFSHPTLKVIATARDLTGEMLSGTVTTAALLFAISNEGRESTSDGVRRFLHEQFAAVPKAKYRKAFRTVNNEESDDVTDLVDSDIEKISPYALEIFNKAQEFSELTPRDGEIHVRHLLAALLVTTETYSETGAQIALRELGIDVLHLRQAFLKKLIDRYIGLESGKDSLAVWQYILFSDQSDKRRRMSGFNSDVYTDVDLLDIDKDVDAFATLIAARTVTPPLSIGIFGDWGSGKSFFMRRLIKRVDEITATARQSEKPQRELGVYRRVAQIEFNAWHYVEGNLWASLVENIFENLKISQSEENDDQAVIKRRDALLDTLKVEEAAKAKVEAQAQEAQERLDQKDEEIKKVAEAHKDKTDQLANLSSGEALAAVNLSVELNPETRAELNSILNLAGVSMLGTATRELQSALSEARSVYERGNTLLTPMLKAQDGRKRFIKLLLILFAAPLIALLIRYVVKWYRPELGNLSAYLAGITTLMTLAAGWIKQQAAWTSERLRKAEEVKLKVDKQAEDQMAQLRAQNAKEMATYTQELELLKAQYAALLTERAEVQKRVEQIKTELEQSTAVQMLARFIQDRAASEDYRKYLGLLALIRRDFSSLSNLIQKGNEELAVALENGKDEEEVAPVNRIVLYIDDLDRCPPRKVIAVLQAVHLLLAFPLFVVVVGVDGRWVAQSLKKGYPGLLSEYQTGPISANEAEAVGVSATPHDYLEKIFQIPFWLNPLADASTKNMVRNLMPVAGSPGEPQILIRNQSEHSHSQSPLDEVSSGELRETVTKETLDVDEQALKQTTAGSEVKGDSAASVSTNEERLEKTFSIKFGRDVDLNPASLDTVAAELEFVEALTPLLGRSPRAVKRFINIYRLVKVRLEPVETASFLDETVPQAEFKVVMFLLSITTGMPAISRDLFQILMRVSREQGYDGEASITRTVGHDFNWLTREASPKSSQRADWECLREWLANYDGGRWMTMDIGTAAAWSNRIARYSFNIRQGMS